MRAVPTACSQIVVSNVTLQIGDFGGSGAPALLIHGLCGTGLEWASTAEWLSRRCRVVAYDQRGHGNSTRRPANVDHAALVEDAAAVIRQFELAPAIVIGQSLGGRIAFLLAARHPDLVKALVVVDASPDRNPEVKASLQKVCLHGLFLLRVERPRPNTLAASLLRLRSGRTASKNAVGGSGRNSISTL
jgi:pimeloyl-ACP methyl ester carboxylesterase